MSTRKEFESEMHWYPARRAYSGPDNSQMLMCLTYISDRFDGRRARLQEQQADFPMVKIGRTPWPMISDTSIAMHRQCQAALHRFGILELSKLMLQYSIQ
jgi:hypothetical protein